MKNTLNLATVDLGASSGRVMLTRFDGDRLSLEEAHRFPNGAVGIQDHLHWDVLRLFQEIKTGLQKAGQIAPLSSLGLDTWGVDFGLLDFPFYFVQCFFCGSFSLNHFLFTPF